MKSFDTNVINTKVFVGLTEQSALDLARDSEIKARITSRDGKPLIVTRDVVPERLNLSIEKGRVVNCTLG